MKKQNFILFLIITSLVSSCKFLSENEKNKAVDARNDTLFKGLHFGMVDSVFYDYCLKQNTKKQFAQGGQKNSSWITTKLISEGVNYELNFFPKFENKKISEMEVAIYYDFSLKNDKKYNHKQLLNNVLSYLKNEYDQSFRKVAKQNPFEEARYVSAKNNRGITVWLEPIGNYINVHFVDLSVKKVAK